MRFVLGKEDSKGEFRNDPVRVAEAEIEHGCDPNESNDFGVRYRDLRIV